MANCTPEFWTLKDIRDALEKEWNGNRKIVIPMFQRGKRWDKDKKETFIDSLSKRYPIGTLLFYKTIEESKETYTLIDGLQRGTAIRDYLSRPTKYFKIQQLKSDTIDAVYALFDFKEDIDSHKRTINDIICYYVNHLQKYEDLEIFELFNLLTLKFPNIKDKVNEFGKIIRSDFKFLKDEYNSLCQMTIPAIVYTGEESTLSEIFERINSKGVPLTDFEIYAASWPKEEFVISNTDIIEAVLRKYDSLNDDEYTIRGYNRDEKRRSRKVSAFEYTFGLSKYIQEKYHSLNFFRNLEADETNPVAFQIINACFNTSHSQIKDVHKIIITFKNNIDIFEKCLLSSIEFVDKCIEHILKFKGNSRKSHSKIFHSQFQIMSLISFVFRSKYEQTDDGLTEKVNWKASKFKLEQNIWKYYIFDIISNYWGDGGTSKIHASNLENRYFNSLSYGQFSSAYDVYSEGLFSRRESRKVHNPSDADYVILNTIYVNSFSAMDQLSLGKFDVEHIASKDQMKNLIKKCNGDGLPISHIANICYLPEFENRSKGSNNFYQDDKYLKKAKTSIETIEEKYSFTKKQDLEFMDISYTAEDFEVLKTYYVDEFLKARNAELKKKFLSALDLEIPEILEVNKAPASTEIVDDKYYRTTKIGEIVREGFAFLVEHNKLSLQDLLDLQDSSFSSDTLGCKFPVFVEDHKKIFDHNGEKRYYKDPITYNGKSFFLTKEWYEHDRPKVVSWFKLKRA